MVAKLVTIIFLKVVIDVKKEGYNVNYTTTFNYSNNKIDFSRLNGTGVWRYKEFMPIDKHIKPVTLKEGNTPLYHLKKLGDRLLDLKIFMLKRRQEILLGHIKTDFLR